MTRNTLPLIILAIALLVFLLANCATTKTTTLPDGSIVVEAQQADTALIDAIFTQYGPDALALIQTFMQQQDTLDLLHAQNAPEDIVSQQEATLNFIRDALITLRDSGLIKNTPKQ